MNYLDWFLIILLIVFIVIKFMDVSIDYKEEKMIERHEKEILDLYRKYIDIQLELIKLDKEKKGKPILISDRKVDEFI